MALTDQQLNELNIAAQRVAQGGGTTTDISNLEYAKKNYGYQTPVDQGSLSGTNAKPISPTQPAIPAPTGATTSQPGAFASVVDSMRTKLAVSQDLVDLKNKVVTGLYDRPLTPEEKLSLTPSVRDAMESGDRNRIDQELRIINDQIKGRTDSLDTSVQYLTSAYQTDIKTANDLKQQHFDNVMNAYSSGGSAAFANMPADQKKALETELGLPSGFFDTPSIAELSKGKVVTDPNTGAQLWYDPVSGQLRSLTSVNPTSGTGSGIVTSDGQFFDIFD